MTDTKCSWCLTIASGHSRNESAALTKGAVRGVETWDKGLQREWSVIEPFILAWMCYTAITNGLMGDTVTRTSWIWLTAFLLTTHKHMSAIAWKHRWVHPAGWLKDCLALWRQEGEISTGSQYPLVNSQSIHTCNMLNGQFTKNQKYILFLLTVVLFIVMISWERHHRWAF